MKGGDRLENQAEKMVLFKVFFGDKVINQKEEKEMKRLLMAVTALVLVFSLTSASQAADKAGKITAGVDLGYALPLGDFGDGCDGSFALGVNGGYWINKMVQAGLGLMYNIGHGVKGTDESISILAITPQVKVAPLEGPISPNLQAGLGLFRTADGDSEMDFGFAIGAGADYNINDNVSAGISLKYNYIMTDVNATTYLGIGVGANYAF